MIMICWVMVIMDTKDMHLCVSIKYQAGLRGLGHGDGHDCGSIADPNSNFSCRVMGYATALPA